MGRRRTHIRRAIVHGAQTNIHEAANMHRYKRTCIGTSEHA
jgi:hypothetical protein